MEKTLSVRVTSETREQFISVCTDKLNRRYSDVLREFIEAMIEGRVTIQPTEAQQELYK